MTPGSPILDLETILLDLTRSSNPSQIRPLPCPCWLLLHPTPPQHLLLLSSQLGAAILVTNSSEHMLRRVGIGMHASNTPTHADMKHKHTQTTDTHTHTHTHTHSVEYPLSHKRKEIKVSRLMPHWPDFSFAEKTPILSPKADLITVEMPTPA